MNPMDHKQLWVSALAQIEMSLSKANYSTWFKDTFVVKFEDGVVHLGVPNAFVQDWLVKKYHKFILKTLRDLSEHVRSIDYVISKNSERAKERREGNGSLYTLPLNENIVGEDGLNPRYTFETFVVGSFNEHAHAASQAVAEQPGTVYNPLFVYGNTGHGKTHLIQAIGNKIKERYPEKKVCYVSSDKYFSEFVNSLQNKEIGKFKDRYRKLDVFIMDDSQFLGNKKETQNELFHLFNILRDSGKQVIFSSDTHPNLIPELADRLRSRLNQGIVVDIPAPDHESRVAILKNKAQTINLPVSDEIITYLSSALDGNIRELEGALNALACEWKLKGKDITLTDAKNIVKTATKPKRMASVKEVIKTIAEFYNLDEEAIINKTRKKEVVKPRQVVMYVLREYFNVSYPSIGEKLGGRDHTTVIHSCEKIKNDLKNDSELLQEINQIRTFF